MIECVQYISEVHHVKCSVPFKILVRRPSTPQWPSGGSCSLQQAIQCVILTLFCTIPATTWLLRQGYVSETNLFGYSKEMTDLFDCKSVTHSAYHVQMVLAACVTVCARQRLYYSILLWELEIILGYIWIILPLAWYLHNLCLSSCFKLQTTHITMVSVGCSHTDCVFVKDKD